MKKRIVLRLVSMSITAAILFSCGGQLLAAETDEASVWGRNTVESAADTDETFEDLSGEVSIEEYIDIDFDNDYLAEQYIISNMSLNRQAYYGTYDFEGSLSSYNLTLYNYLLPHIKAIAAGTETNTAFEDVPEDVFGFTFTFKELGLDNNPSDADISAAVSTMLNKMGFNPTTVIRALLYSCPYDMYWMDKTARTQSGYSWGSYGSNVTVNGFYIGFPVAGEYRGDNIYTVNSKFGQAVTAAAANAKTIITTNASSDDYNKLLAYAEVICDSVDYNYDAADGYFEYSYGNPWQLIWVFDGDDDTKVVCEGYSKAFQYLCDNTAFVDDSIYAISVSGTVVYFEGDEPGAHMWNVVHMDDGKNYIVDVTAIDTGDSDSFLKGATSSTVSECVDTNGYVYTYSSETKSVFAGDAILIASADYEAPSASYKVELGTLSKDCDPVLSASKAAEGDKITVTVNPVAGYEFDYITVNGTKISETEFMMPAEDVTVNVYCKKIDYTITCSAAENGTVTTNTQTANVGDEITITATPADGYVLDSVTVKDADGNTIELTKNGVFYMPASDVTVTAAFKKIGYKVELGNIIKNCNPKLSTTTAAEGEKITVTVNPVGGFEFDYIMVNDTKISATEFTMPAEDVVVNVYCKKIDFTITCAEAQNGTVTTNTNSANVGDIITVTATPDEGYELDAITVKDADGNVVEVNNSEFQMPASAVTVSATFKKTVAATGWVQEGDVWYYINEDGTKATGWLKVGAWYYFNESGVMQTGWQKIDDVWYYFRDTGSMYAGEWLKWGDKWYYLKDNGAMATGWFQVGSIWYLFNDSGAMLTGWQQVNGKWYYLESSGAMKTGWLSSGGKWYYLNASGDMATGWVKDGDLWYYMDPSTGAMVTGTVRIGRKRYRFADDGHCLNP